MTKKQLLLLKNSRLLKPKQRADLLSWVHLAYFAENSARKCLGTSAVTNGVSISEPQEYSSGKLFQRSKK